MRKILLASIAALPLLAVAALPASAQELNKPEKGVSQSQGGKSQVRPQPTQVKPQPGQAAGKPQGGAQAGVKVSQGVAQPKIERGAQTKAARPSEKKTIGQSQTQERVKAQANETRKEGRHQANARTPAKSKTGEIAQGGKSELSPSQSKAKPGSAKQTGGAQAHARIQKVPTRTTGQATQPNAHPQPSGQTENRGQVENRGAASTGAKGSVTLSDEQRTRIQQSVLAGRGVPRVNRVDFAMDVGTVVPAHVRVVAVPTVLIDIHPEWQGDEYFVVRDEIVIVDRGRRIVAMVPIGSASSAIGTRGLAGGSDIREVQQVLLEKGFYHGPVDGVMGYATREALIAFQRQQEIAVTGRIDTRTMTSLGIAGRTQGQAVERTGGRELQVPNQSRSGQNLSGQNGRRNVAVAKEGKEGKQAAHKAQHPTTAGQGENQPAAKERKPAAASDHQHPSTSGQSGGQPSINQGNKAGPSGTGGQSTKQRRPNQPGQGGASHLNQ